MLLYDLHKYKYQKLNNLYIGDSVIFKIPKKHNFSHIALYFLILVGFALRLFQIDKQSLWFDDIITVHLAKLPFVMGLDGLLGQGIQLTPFYHLVVKTWLLIGDNQTEWFLRFPGVCFSLVSLPLMYKLGKLYVGHTTGLVAMALIAINPYQIWYAHEVKIYSALVVASIGAMYAFGIYLKRHDKSALIKLGLFNMLGFSIHHFMFLIPTVQFVFILTDFKRYFRCLRGWLITHIISGAILIPWFAFIFYRQIIQIGIGWVPTPHVIEPFLTFWNFTIGYREEWTLFHIMALCLVIIVFILGLLEVRKIHAWGRLILLWVFLPIIMVWLFSQGKMSFYVDRYFLVITPAIILILATGVIGQKSNFSKELCFSNVMLGMMVLMATGYGLFHTKFNEKYFTRDDWRSMANIIRHEAQEEDVLVSCTDGWRLALDYYGVGATFDADKAYFNYPKNTDFNNVVPNYKHIWIPTNNVRLPQHHLGYSYNFPLAVDILPTEVQTWFSQHKPDVFSVAGITTYRYNLDDDVTDFNILIDWHCSQPKP